jgi:hypothetical protein
MKCLALVALLLGNLGCGGQEAMPQIPTGPAEGLFAVDLDGDGTDAVVQLAGGRLIWPGGSLEVQGSLHAWDSGIVAEVETLVLGFGRSKAAPKAEPAIVVLNAQGAMEVQVPSSLGQRVTDISIGPEGTLVTILGAAKKAQGFSLVGNTLSPQTTSTMGLQQVALPAPNAFAVGTLYGPEPRSHGGLEIRAADGSVRFPPTVRGIRTMILTDVDRNGVPDLVVGDGWHFRYGHEAQALLSVYPGPDFTERVAIGTLPGSYTINEIIPIQSGGGTTLIVLGSSEVAQFKRTGLGWEHERLSAADSQTQIGLWSRSGLFRLLSPDHWLLVAGTNPKMIKIR